jgi:Sigma-70, region 4
MREPLPVEIEEHEGAAPDAHAAAVHRQETGELRDALAQLPLQQREAILLRELRGLSYQEVAASLAVTTSAVESLLFRARRSLKVRLQEALAALTPVAWIQDLVSRLVGGGLGGPAAAKVAAVGLGTAVATSGALVAPTVIGLGHAPPPRISSPPAPRHRPARSTAPKPTVWATAAPHPSPIVVVSRPRTGDGGGGDSGSSTEISDRQRSSGTGERDSSSNTTSPTAGDGSGSTHETGDGKTTSAGTGASTSSASTDSAGATATDSGSGD